MPLSGYTSQLRSVGWFYPAYIQNRHVMGLADKIRAEPERKHEIFAAELPALYTPFEMAPMVVDRYHRVPVSKDFARTINEAIHAYWLGLYHVATASLAPVVEGMVRRIAKTPVPSHNAKQAKKGCYSTIDDLISELDAKAGDEGARERAGMFRCFKSFLEEDFWQKIADFKGETGLNRHAILHGVYGDGQYESRVNFLILISVVDLLTFMGTFKTRGVSVLAPSPSKASAALAKRWMDLFEVRHANNNWTVEGQTPV